MSIKERMRQLRQEILLRKWRKEMEYKYYNTEMPKILSISLFQSMTHLHLPLGNVFNSKMIVLKYLENSDLTRAKISCKVCLKRPI